MSQTVDITPHKSLISKLGHTGYRTEQAVAELVDNAIDARLDGIKEKIIVELDFRSNRITVTDDGRGMGAEALADAFTIAKYTGNGGLGRFGMGMKSACSSLGKRFEVSTTEAGAKTRLAAKYNEKEWLKDDSRGWDNFEISESAADSKEHGTAVIIEDLRVPLYPNQAPNFRKRFGIRYGPHLKDGLVEIVVNSRTCEPAEPDLRDGTRREISIDLPSGRTITGWVGMLEKRSIKGDYGIHLYWHGRLIKAFAKFGIRKHPTVAGVVGSLSMDHVPVNFHKTGFVEEAPEYAEAEECFRKDAALADVLRSCSSRDGAGAKIQDMFRDGPTKPVETRIGIEKAESLLRGAKEFTVERSGVGMDVKFAEGHGGIYDAGAVDGKIQITVERDSTAFRAFRNPLLLLGWISIESELLASGPRDMRAFIAERNKRWAKFVKEAIRRDADRPVRPAKVPTPTPNYSLSYELADLHDSFAEGFGHRFQFTAASTLSPFMRNLYRRAVYTVHVPTGTGDQALDITDGKFAALVEPSGEEVYTVLDLRDRIVVVRETAERLVSTWAPPEKAWMDLYREVARGITMYADELDWVFDELVGDGLVDPATIRSLAKRRGMSRDIEPYLEAA